MIIEIREVMELVIKDAKKKFPWLKLTLPSTKVSEGFRSRILVSEFYTKRKPPFGSPNGGSSDRGKFQFELNYPLRVFNCFDCLVGLCPRPSPKCSHPWSYTSSNGIHRRLLKSLICASFFSLSAFVANSTIELIMAIAD